MLIVDLSSNNEEPDFRALSRHVGGAWIKASEGTTYANPFYKKWSAEADRYGMRVGAYHFARPQNDAVAEARHFCAVAGKPGRRDLRPVLDFETWDGALTPKQHETWARTFNNVCRREIGQTPIFYSYGPFIQRMNLKSTIGNGLWLASYGKDDGKEYPAVVPAPWKRMVAHQFTSHASVVGCKGVVDLSDALRLNAVLAHPLLGHL